MDETELSIFSTQNEEEEFIILPSQVETQQASEIEEQFTKMVKDLPALQDPSRYLKKQDDMSINPQIVKNCSQTMKQIEDKPTEVLQQPDEAECDNFVLSSQQDMFTENDDNEDDVHPISTHPVSTPAQTIGSLHVSQNPMLVPETIDDTVNEIPPTQDMYDSTPIIIPSSPTQDTGDQVTEDQLEVFDENVCSNKNDGQSKPLTTNISLYNNRVVELSLTKNDDDDNMSSFHLDSADTLCSQSQNVRNSPMVSDDVDVSSVTDNQVNIPAQKDSTQFQSFGHLLQPTLLENDQSMCDKHKLTHVTKQSDSNPLPSLEIIGVEMTSKGIDPLEAPLSTQTLKGSREVIVINSDTHQSQQEDSQDLDLHLTLTGSQLSDVHHSQTQSSDREPFQQSGNQTIVHKDAGREEDKSSGNAENCEKLVIELDCDKISSTRMDTSPEPVKSQTGVGEVEKSVEKDSIEQQDIDLVNNNDKVMNTGKKSNADVDCEKNSDSTSGSTTENIGSQSNSQEKRQKSGKDYKSHSEWKRSKKRAKMQQKVNDNPLIEWKNENDAETTVDTDINREVEVSSNRFSDEFHLLVPKSTDCVTQNNEIEFSSTKPFCAEQIVNRSSTDVDDTLKLPVSTSSRCEQDQLLLQMIDSDTEASQTEFKLQKPQIEDLSALDDSQDNIPVSSSNSSKQRRKARFILEDSDDEELNLIDEGPVQTPEMLIAQKLNIVVEANDQSNLLDEEVALDSKSNESKMVESRGDVNVVEDNEFQEDNLAQPAELNEHDEALILNRSTTDTAIEQEKITVVTGETEPATEHGKLSKETQDEVFVAEKKDIDVNTNEMTQDYDHNVPMETSMEEKDKSKIPQEPDDIRNFPNHSTDSDLKEINDKPSDGMCEKNCDLLVKLNDIEDKLSDLNNQFDTEPYKSSHVEEEKSNDLKDQVNVDPDKPGTRLEDMSVNTTQKVVEYLQTGFRSRSSSTCTETSAESFKSPVGSKRKSESKSPQEVKDVLKRYGDILNKKHRSRNDSGHSDKNLPSSLAPNPDADDGDKTTADKIRRRLSTQSLPAEKSETNVELLKRQLSHTTLSQSDQAQEKNPNRHSINNYYCGKIFDDILDSKNVKVDTEKKTDKPQPGCHKVKLNTSINKLNLHTVGVSSVNANRKSTSDKDAVERTRIKSKSDIGKVDNKGWLTSNKVDITNKTMPGKDKNSVDKSHTSLIQKLNVNKSINLIEKRQSDVKNGDKSTTNRTLSNSFVSSSQTFTVSNTGHDPYQFHGSQSQIASDEASVFSPPSKRQKLNHQEIIPEQQVNDIQELDKPPSEISIETTTTIGSSPLITSSSGQSDAELQNIERSGTVQLTNQTLADSLINSPRSNKNMVTMVTETIERVFTEITTVTKVIGPQGNIITSSQNVERFDPVIVKENTTKKYIPASAFNPAVVLTPCDIPSVKTTQSPQPGSKRPVVKTTQSPQPGSKRPVVKTTQSPQPGSKLPVVKTTQSPQKKSNEEKSVPPVSGDSKSEDKSKSHNKTKSEEESKLEHKSKSEHKKKSQDKSKSDDSSKSEERSKPKDKLLSQDKSKSDDSSKSEEGLKPKDKLKSEDKLKTKGKLKTEAVSKSQNKSKLEDKLKTGGESKTSDKPAPVSSSLASVEQAKLVMSSGGIGSRVIAKWKDDFYYPGCLKSSSDRYSKYQVLFDDGDSMMVKGTDILCIERLPVGQSVMVLSQDEVFEYGLITAVQPDTYTVGTDDGKSGSVSLSQVILTSDQASCILSDNGKSVTLQCQVADGQPVNYGDVSLENLIDAPRRSAKKTLKEDNDKIKPHSDTGRGHKRKLDMVEPGPSSPTKSSHQLFPSKFVKVPSSPRSGGVMGSPVNKRRKVLDVHHGIHASPQTARHSKSRADSSKNQLGPIPKKKMFSNMYFVLTNIDKSKELLDQEKQLLRESSLDTSDESAIDDEIIAPFEKDHLKSQITAGGGTVLDDLTEKMVNASGRRIMLLSSSYQRTLKYLQCLACGIPCLSHMWIVDSCTQGNLLDEKSYILPAGVSIEKKKIMELKKKKALFQGVKAVVYSKDKQFVECWSQILSFGKCTIHKQLQYTDVHVIVTDSSCTSTMERQASSKGVAVVGTEWVIQSLINGRLVSYTGNLKYRHDTS